jgi:hypothetical protein
MGNTRPSHHEVTTLREGRFSYILINKVYEGQGIQNATSFASCLLRPPGMVLLDTEVSSCSPKKTESKSEAHLSVT